jgi:transposase-like protein
MECPKCKQLNFAKDGIVLGRQRYRCKTCGFRYTVAQKSDVKPLEVRKAALGLYLEGLSFRAIGNILDVSYVTVFKWVKEWEATAALPKREKAIAVVSPEEMGHYIHSKNSIPDYGLLLVDLKNGSSFLCASPSHAAANQKTEADPATAQATGEPQYAGQLVDKVEQ